MTRVVVTVLCLRRLFLGHALSGQVQVLSRDLSKRLESRELLRRCKGKIHFLAMLHLARSRRVRMSRLRHVVGEGQLVHLQQRALPVLERKRRTFLDEVIREAVYASFGELRLVSSSAPWPRDFCRGDSPSRRTTCTCAGSGYLHLRA